MFEATDIPDLFVVTPKRFGDHRGFFSESYSARAFADQGLTFGFCQDNHSLSTEVGTVRGLHYQSPPHAQTKLVRCGRGAIFDAVVDVRTGSPTFGKWFGIELSFENGKQLLVPKGFLHGFMTLVPDSEIVYKCDDFYAPDCDGSVLWNSCGIAWPTVETARLSPKDEAATPFADFESPFVYGEY